MKLIENKKKYTLFSIKIQNLPEMNQEVSYIMNEKLPEAPFQLITCTLVYRAVLDIANPIDPIDRSIRILNQVVAMEHDEALRRPRWCGQCMSRDLL